ncbi:MAG TPA: DUF2061 domain-containing protein [Patescibacteria group bacterium]|nr:DUF2061 domain-containing protein [Patescibacteria group bacterium]
MKIKFPVIAKTATYGVMHMVISFFTAWFVTGNFYAALGISALEPSVQIFGYFIHEKAWQKWGRNHPSQAAPDWNVGGCGHVHDIGRPDHHHGHDHKH